MIDKNMYSNQKKNSEKKKMDLSKLSGYEIPTCRNQQPKPSTHSQSPRRSNLEEEAPSDEATEEEEEDGSYFVVARGIIAKAEKVGVGHEFAPCCC